MKRINLIILLGIILTFSQNIFANTPVPKKFIISGKVIDKSSGQAMEYANVSLYHKENDKLITGVITDANGQFSINSPSQEVYLKVSFIGYKEKQVKSLQFTKNKSQISSLILEPNLNQLNEVSVVAEKSETYFKLDKRVFNVGKDLSSAGGSALEILNNVPSVDVNLQGQISLRGNTGVQILINGKPSVLTSGKTNALGTITSDMIERVEVITNPSAKYDAEGTTGLINIVLKKNDRKGLSGAMSVNTGTPMNHSIGLSINQRNEKWNLFSQIGVGKRNNLSNSEGLTINRSTTNPNQLSSATEGEKVEQFYNIVLGADYQISPLQVFSMKGHAGYELEDESSDAVYKTSDYKQNLLSSNTRNQSTDGKNPKLEYEMQYEKTFADNEERSLLISAKTSYFGKKQNSLFENKSSDQVLEILKQKSDNQFSNSEYTFRTDYTHPIGDMLMMELGAKYDLGRIRNEATVQDYNGTSWNSNLLYNSDFELNRHNTAAYLTLGFETEIWGVKGGLRQESIFQNTHSYDLKQKSNTNYHDWFPSIHTSLNLNEKNSLQLGYSRRIDRPELWDLNPSISLQDNINRYIGNPDLMPEYTNSMELTGIHTSKNFSMNLAVFHGITNNVTTETVELQDTISITHPKNVGKSKNTGAELNAKLDIGKSFSLMADAYYMYYQRYGDYKGQSFDFESSSWATRLTGKFRLPYDFDMELRFRYRSKEKQLFRNEKASAYMDFGLRKKIKKGKYVINLSVRDVFNSRSHNSVMDNSSYYVSEKYWRSRKIVLGVSYSFGKGEAMEFSGQKMF